MLGASGTIGTGGIPYDYNTSDKIYYSVKPPTFGGDSTQFEWWKSKMYTYIIGLDDELWDILEDDINIEFNGVGMVTDRKNLIPTYKKIYRKHNRVRGIVIEALPHSEYIKIINKSTAKTIFKSLCSTYKWNQQFKEAKVNLLVQHYELFVMKNDEDIEIMFSRFQVLVSGLQVLSKSYTTSDHLKKILRSLPVRYKPKAITIQEAKDMNTLSLESMLATFRVMIWN